MDYWERVEVHRYIAFDDFEPVASGRRIWALTTRGRSSLWEAAFERGDVLLFGPESRGLPFSLLQRFDATTLRIPMVPDSRSLNLANAASIALYEALRQLGAGGLLR
jgi:tRNA (cytidine/uridine-2'-O-)-methyltransferase